MRLTAGVFLAVAAALGPTILADAPVTSTECVCATARATNAWCAVHGSGYVGGVKLSSYVVYVAIDPHGHDLDLSKFDCPKCQAAIVSDGFCEADRIGFVKKKAYFSGLTYELGRAEVHAASSIACRTCRKNSDTHGWCAKSGVGRVGPFEIRDRKGFDRAVADLERLVAADRAAPRCPRCATAILYNSECMRCRISYKDGKAIGAPAAGTSR